jgi:hypothetical protein
MYAASWKEGVEERTLPARPHLVSCIFYFFLLHFITFYIYIVRVSLLFSSSFFFQHFVFLSDKAD